MSITRRNALVSVVGCGLTSIAAGAGERPAGQGSPPSDPVLSQLPPAVRKVFESTFPGHRCIRLVTRGRNEAAVYRGTFFNPANWSSTTGGLVNGESVVTPPLFHLELDASASVLEETYRSVDPKQLPKPVQAAYRKWNPKGITSQEHYWLTEVARGQPRVYRVAIILSAVKAYRATFREDGSIVEADPVVVP